MKRYNEPGYCEHGTYVGGCGIDWMCGWCEDGWTWDEYVEYIESQRLKLIRRRAEQAQRIMHILLSNGVPGIEALGQLDRLTRHM